MDVLRDPYSTESKYRMSEQFNDSNPQGRLGSTQASRGIPGSGIPNPTPGTATREQTERNRAAIELVTTWLREDARIESDTWDSLKSQLDRDRSPERVLFP